MNKQKHNQIERYVYDVVRRLPEKERDDVRQELEANIYDMLGDDTSFAHTEEVLYSMGKPAKLAEEYRSTPKYLISPAIYEDYIRVLKIVLPIVAIVMAMIGIVQGLLQGQNLLDASFVFKHVIGHAVGLSVSATLQVLVWTTLGFVIYERMSGKKEELAWSIDNLPEVPAEKAKSIPLADVIAELIVGVVFIVGVVLIFGDFLPFKVAIYENGSLQAEIFAKPFVLVLIPTLILMMAFSMVESLCKLVYRHWNIKVCIVSIISHLVGFVGCLYLVNQPKIFSNAFIAYVTENDIDLGAFVKVGNHGFENSVIYVLIVLAIVGALIGITTAIVRTVLYYQRKNKLIA